MKLTLRENAWDSLNYAYEYYTKFLNLENKKKSEKTFLKMTIIMLHNAIELFLKSLLIDIDELLIYDMNNLNKKRELVRLFYDQKKDINTNINFENIAIQNPGVKTIDFSEALELCASTFNINYKYYVCCKWISEYRNMITHFGINLDNEYYKVILCIDGLFEFVFSSQGIAKELNTKELHLTENSPLYKYLGIMNHSEKELIRVYREEHKSRIDEITDMIEQCLSDSHLLERLKSMNILMTPYKVDNVFNGINIEYKNEYNNKLYLEMNFSPLQNIVYFREYNGLQPFIIICNDSDKEKDLIFISEDIENQNDWYDEKFWRKYSTITSCYHFEYKFFLKILELTCTRMKKIYDEWDYTKAAPIKEWTEDSDGNIIIDE